MGTRWFWNMIVFRSIEITSVVDVTGSPPVFEPTPHSKLAFPGWFCWDPLLLDRKNFLAWEARPWESTPCPSV